jgi:glycosyltransferase involved in cell wall biosynthesis
MTLRASVIISTFNRRRLVLDAIESVRRQSLASHEVIVVIDGSSDDTATAVRAIDPSVVVIEQENCGLAVSRNRGAAMATGDWICFLDDDDLWHPEKLRKAAEYVGTHPDCRALLSPAWYFTTDQSGPSHHLGIARDFVAGALDECVQCANNIGLLDYRQAERLRRSTLDIPAILRRNQGLYISSAMIRRDVLLASGGSCPMFSAGEDWTLLMNVARLTSWHVLDERLVFTRFHRSQMSIGGGRASLGVLVATAGMWYAGRPFADACGADSVRSRIQQAAPEYRQMVRARHWRAIRALDLGLSADIRAAARLLLPRRRDRLSALCPPPIVSGVRKLIANILRR